MVTTPAHNQTFDNRYSVHYPDHKPRKDDPHYKDFEAYRAKTKASAKCTFGLHRNDFSECSGELELHHTHIEFALQNEIDLQWLEVDYPGVSNPDEIGAWVESAANLEWLCGHHHRSVAGVHRVDASNFEGEKYVRGLISDAK